MTRPKINFNQMSIVLKLGVFNLPRLTYHLNVDELLFYGYNWNPPVLVTIFVSMNCQQRSLAIAYINCSIFNSEVQLRQKHCSLVLDFAMVSKRRMKQGFSVIFDHIFLKRGQQRDWVYHNHAKFIDLESTWISSETNFTFRQSSSCSTYPLVRGNPRVFAKDILAVI